jgi:hypothetical protein
MLALNVRAVFATSGKDAIDTFFLPADGSVVNSNAQLRVGKKYSVVGGGLRQYSFYWNGTGYAPVLADAMYGLKADGSLDYAAPVMLIDNPFGQNGAVANVENFAAHRYVFHITPTGVEDSLRTISLRVLDSYYGDNAFGHSISIYKGHLKKVPAVQTQPDDDGAED